MGLFDDLFGGSNHFPQQSNDDLQSQQRKFYEALYARRIAAAEQQQSHASDTVKNLEEIRAMLRGMSGYYQAPSAWTKDPQTRKVKHVDSIDVTEREKKKPIIGQEK